MLIEKQNTFETMNMSHITPDVISVDSFQKLSRIVYRESGIYLGNEKRMMLSSRLSKRLRATGCPTYEAYIEYLVTSEHASDELISMVDVVTTNKTEFFREKHHFEYLADTLLPKLEKQYAFHPGSPLRVWSAGCSTGQEPYTLSFVLSEFFQGDTTKYRILATDLSTRVLREAREGIYLESNLEGIPKLIRLKYMHRGGGNWSEYRRVIPEIRRTVIFGKLNLMDDSYGIKERFHVIFHRNVMIYFDRQTRKVVVQKLWEHLVDNGHLFIGHSERLDPDCDNFILEAQTVYRKQSASLGES